MVIWLDILNFRSTIEFNRIINHEYTYIAKPFSNIKCYDEYSTPFLF